MQIIENKSFGCERALYESKGLILKNCTFEGLEDGESALKESSNIEVYNSTFKLRYPFWHDQNALVDTSTFEETARAPFWYTNELEIKNSKINSPKALRECSNIVIENTIINSSELGWSCDNVTITDSELSGEYFLFRSSNINFKGTTFSGKYSFQYIENATIEDSTLNTKDAFWHAKNIHIKNCTVNGEYLGWYSENLTFENCKISGTQPFCYAKGLTLINCQMQGCDLSFEKSEVNATLTAPILSIKNPISGRIEVPSVGEIILDYKTDCKIVIKEEALV